MHFQEFAKAIALWVGGLSTAYTLVFFNALYKGSRGLGSFGTKVILMAVAVAALVFIVRTSKGHWSAVFGALLVAFSASYLCRSSRVVTWAEEAPSAEKVQQAGFHAEAPFCFPVRCEDD